MAYFGVWIDFYEKSFIKLFKRKVSDEGHIGDYKENFGLSEDKLLILRKQVDGFLKPVIRSGEEFDFDKVLERFNVILKKV